MREVLTRWYQRYLSEEEAVILLILLVVAFVVMLMTPAEAFFPNRVLCGPRSTSMRSISTRLPIVCPG